MRDPSTGERRQLHQVLVGEMLAGDIARGLSLRMPTAGLRRAYEKQARDEEGHAALIRARLVERFGDRSAPHIAEFDPFCRTLRDAVSDGRLLHAVVGLNLVLEGFSATGLAATRWYVAARGDDPAWVALVARIERDERRHLRLLLPAVGALGLAGETAAIVDAFEETRGVALGVLRNVAAAFEAWNVDPFALFEHALQQAHPEFTNRYLRAQGGLLQAPVDGR